MADINVSSPGSDEAAVRSAFQAILKNWRVIGASGVAVPLTGSTSETTLATVTIPAGAMGANGIIRVSAQFSCTNNANVKNGRVRLGGLAGTLVNAQTITSTAGAYTLRAIHNRNSQSSQVVSFGSASANSFTTTTVAALTMTVDTSVAQDLVFTGQLATGTDTITLESYLVEVLYQA